MKFLMASDIHLTDSAKDKYRFDLFPWLAQQQKIHNTDAIIIAGDLTNDKDFHSSVLVNKAIDGFKLLKPPVFIDRGNHDGIDPTNPFFKFLNSIPGITFCINTTVIEEYGMVLIPHQANQTLFNEAFKTVPEGFLAVLHQTVTGAISETGSRLTGLAVPSIGRRARAIYSGDIHKPQTVETEGGPVTYIGAPYHCRHGDQFDPRVLLLNKDKETNLYFPAPKKLSLTIRDISELPPMKEGDQLKFTLELDRSEVVEWVNHKKNIIKWCKDRGIEIYGSELKVAQRRRRPKLTEEVGIIKSKSDYFAAFCLSEQVPLNIRKAGGEILEDEQ
jgi:DNA repair exonuclease SbcCD nuclease subunit